MKNKIWSNMVLSLLGINNLTEIQAAQECLYCKRADTAAGFLYSYSYCESEESQSCIQDYWNYIGKAF